MGHKILLGVTGSVAATLTPKLKSALCQIPNVERVSVVVTEAGKYFLNQSGDFCDFDEWYINENNKKWRQKGDPVVHIDLRDEYSALVIAPLTANTLAKMTSGICDNLLTSVYRAWDECKPVLVAPAMNTKMWTHPITKPQIQLLEDWGVKVIPPQTKQLACGTMGIGAMADINVIVENVSDYLQWQFPLKEKDCNGIPVEHHPGAFGYKRAYSHHTGVDLYCKPNSPVFAVENGIVIAKEAFTGPKDNSPWWNDTEALLIEGPTGVVCYGEIEPYSIFTVGSYVCKGQSIGHVIPVLPEGKERPDIPGHSRHMLHMELYDRSRRECSTSWKHDEPKHDYLLDPTNFLLNAKNSIVPKLTERISNG